MDVISSNRKVKDLIEDLIVLKSENESLKSKYKAESSINRVLRKKIETLKLRLSLFATEPSDKTIPTDNPYLIDIKSLENELYIRGKDMDDNVFYTMIDGMMQLTKEMLDISQKESDVELN